MCIRDLFEYSLKQPVPHYLNLPHMSSDIFIRQFDGFPESDNSCDVFCAGPVLSFLAPAMDQIFDGNSFPNIKGTNTFWTIKLMG